MEPIKYNRNLYVNTVAAIQKIQKSKLHREAVHWKN